MWTLGKITISQFFVAVIRLLWDYGGESSRFILYLRQGNRYSSVIGLGCRFGSATMCATIMVDDADGGVTVNVRVVYTDLDGYENTRYLGSIRDAAFYNMIIHSFWGSIDSANKTDKVAKDF